MEILINIDVPDIEQAIAFYEQALGLHVARRLFDGQVAEMAGARTPIYLLQKTAGSRAVPTTSAHRDYRRHWTPVHLDIAVVGLDAAVQRAVLAGAALETPAASFPWGRMATFADPFGHGFCLIEWSAAGYT